MSSISSPNPPLEAPEQCNNDSRDQHKQAQTTDLKGATTSGECSPAGSPRLPWKNSIQAGPQAQKRRVHSLPEADVQLQLQQMKLAASKRPPPVQGSPNTTRKYAGNSHVNSSDEGISSSPGPDAGDSLKGMSDGGLSKLEQQFGTQQFSPTTTRNSNSVSSSADSFSLLQSNSLVTDDDDNFSSVDGPLLRLHSPYRVRPRKQLLGSGGPGVRGARRLSSSIVFQDGYDISPDLEEMVRNALANKYKDQKYREAAIKIQTHYRRHKLQQQYEKIRQRGTGLTSGPGSGVATPSGTVPRVTCTDTTTNTPLSLETTSVNTVTSTGVSPQTQRREGDKVVVSRALRKSSTLTVRSLGGIDAEAMQDKLVAVLAAGGVGSALVEADELTPLPSFPGTQDQTTPGDSTAAAPTDTTAGKKRASQGVLDAAARKLSNMVLDRRISDMLQRPPPPKHTPEEERKLMRLGIHKFNRHPRNGLVFLTQQGLVGESPQSVAAFLYGAHENRISKAMIGEYLGDPAPFRLEVLGQLVKMIGFPGMPFDVALRHYLSHFRLPGEAQKIDRMMDVFARRYFEQNSSTADFPFANSDTAYILAYSCIMLNTDAHNPSVKHKMTKEDFIRNNRGINDGKDLPRAYLEQLYDGIVGSQFITSEEYVEEVRALHARMPGLRQELALPHRYLVAQGDFEEIVSFTARTPGSHPRRLILFNDLLLVCKPRRGQLLVKQMLPLYGLRVLTVCNSRLYKRAFQLHNFDKNESLGAYVEKDKDLRAALPTTPPPVGTTTSTTSTTSPGGVGMGTGQGDEGYSSNSLDSEEIWGSKLVRLDEFVGLVEEYVDEAADMEDARIAQMDSLLVVNTSSTSAPEAACVPATTDSPLPVQKIPSHGIIVGAGPMIHRMVSAPRERSSTSSSIPSPTTSASSTPRKRHSLMLKALRPVEVDKNLCPSPTLPRPVGNVPSHLALGHELITPTVSTGSEGPGGDSTDEHELTDKFNENPTPTQPRSEDEISQHLPVGAVASSASILSDTSTLSDRSGGSVHHHTSFTGRLKRKISISSGSRTPSTPTGSPSLERERERDESGNGGNTHTPTESGSSSPSGSTKSGKEQAAWNKALRDRIKSLTIGKKKGEKSSKGSSHTLPIMSPVMDANTVVLPGGTGVSVSSVGVGNRESMRPLSAILDSPVGGRSNDRNIKLLSDDLNMHTCSSAR